jgi:hypothetical protein
MQKSSSPSSLPSLSVSLCCSAPPPIAPCRQAPALPAAPRRSNPTTWPSSSPARRSPKPCWLFPAPPCRAAVARSRHVAPPIASSCSSSPVPLLGSAARPGALLNYFYPLARPHFASSASSPLSTAARPLLHSLLAAVSQLRRPTSATRCFPSTTTSHRSFTTSSSPSSRAYAAQNATILCHCRPAAPPPLGPHRAHHQHYIYAWKIPSHFFAAFLHSSLRNATAALGPRRAGLVLHQTAVSAPSFFDSGHPRARYELLNHFPHFPFAASDPPRQNLIASVVVPRFKPARDLIASNLFFLEFTL